MNSILYQETLVTISRLMQHFKYTSKDQTIQQKDKFVHLSHSAVPDNIKSCDCIHFGLFQ